MRRNRIAYRTRHAALTLRHRRARFALVLAIAAGGAAATTLASTPAAATAAGSTQFVSSATSHSGGSTIVAGTTLTINYNETPVLASAYSLTLTDGTNVGTLSTAAHNVSAAVNGQSITFTATGAPSGESLSLNSPLEILGATGITDGSGNPWNLVASGQVDKSYVLSAGDTVVVNFDEPVTVGGGYSLTLQEGSNRGVINSSNVSNVSGSGTSQVSFTLNGPPAMQNGAAVAADGPTVSAFSGISATPTVQTGDTLTAVFTGTVTGASPYSLTLRDGSGDTGTLSGSALGAPVITANTPSAGQTTVAYAVNGAPTLTAGSAQLFDAGLQATAQSGLTGASTPFSLAVTGPGPAAPTVASDSVTIDPLTTCANLTGYTRVIGGTNCGISNGGGPIAPDVFDVIPLPTTDLPGPPDDNAPEVITNCQHGSTDYVFDVNTGAELGSNPCGQNPPEQNIGNTNSDTLDYIPTPHLASFEEAGVVETVPGTSYVSPTAVPPQISGVMVSGNQATFSYYTPVVCQVSGGDFQTWSQFSYVSPYRDLTPADRVYPVAISCPSSSGGTSVTVTYGGTIPFSSGVRFKFEGYGPGHFIVGAPGSSFAFEREASQSLYAGPTATIDAFTPQSTTLSTSGAATVPISIATTSALTCSLSQQAFPSTAASLTLPAATCNGQGTIDIPANSSTSSNVIYTVTLTATGVAGTPPVSAEVTITVPPAPAPAPTPPPTTTQPTTPPAPVAAPLARLLKALIESHKGIAIFHFRAIGDSTGFRCALVRKPTNRHAKMRKPAYSKCGATATFRHLKNGSYVLYVRAVGPGGLSKPAVHRFAIHLTKQGKKKSTHHARH